MADRAGYGIVMQQRANVDDASRLRQPATEDTVDGGPAQRAVLGAQSTTVGQRANWANSHRPT